MRVLLSCCFFAVTIMGNAQFLEFGAGIGALNYSGDLIRGYQISNIKPGGAIHHRMNFSQFISIRWELVVGKLSGSDQRPIDAFARERDASFNINVSELSSVIEYHFLNYKDDKSIIRWSPYLFGGLAFVKLNGVGERNAKYNLVQPSIPIGIGFKHLIGKRFTTSIEFGMRMMFFDYLDNISEGDLMIKDYQYGNPNDKDRYSYFGLSFSYIIWDIPCPFPYVPNNSILRR